jgi:hypothetical protein
LLLKIRVDIDEDSELEIEALRRFDIFEESSALEGGCATSSRRPGSANHATWRRKPESSI